MEHHAAPAHRAWYPPSWLALVACLIARAATAVAAPQVCPPDRWVAGGGATFVGQPLILGVETAPASLTVPGCDAGALKRATAKGRKKGTLLTAVWRDCAGLRRLAFAGRIGEGCTVLKGKLVGKRTRINVTASPSTCGDGVIDAGGGEQCEGECPGGQICNAACLCEAVTTTTAAPVTTTTLAPTSTTLMTPMMTPGVTTTTTTTTTTVVTPVVTPVITPIVTPIVTPIITPVITPVIVTTTTTLILTPVITPIVTPIVTPVITPVIATTTTTLILTPLVTPVITPPLVTPLIGP